MITTALLSDPISTLAYFLLMAAMVSLWLTPKRIVWVSLLSTSMLAAYLADRLTLIGVFEGVLFGCICFAFYRLPLKSIQKALLGCLLLICAFLLGTHRLPGFKNWCILPSMTLSPDAVPIQLYLNFDKPLIGLGIMAFGLRPIRGFQQTKLLLQSILPIFLCAAITLLGLSLLVGYVRVDLKWVECAGLWLFVNLVSTCVTEEVLFRGFLQHSLTQVLGCFRWGSVSAWGISSVLFGLLHLPGGWVYACLATLAGLFYGYAYRKTQRIEASIGVHFWVNATHFLVFTYPALREIL